MRRFSLFIIFLFVSISSFSQSMKEAKPAIAAIGRSFGDSIVLRWAPNNPMTWKLSNKEGYIIERYTLQKDGKPNKKMVPEKVGLTSSPIKPYPLERWENL